MNPIIERFKKYFAIGEVVDAQTKQRDGEKAWRYFDLNLLEVLVWIRESLGIRMVINTKVLQQRGLRTNVCEIVKKKTLAGILYISGHGLGKAVDFSSPDMSAKDIRKWIRAHINECPHPIRLEDDKSAPTWVPIDTMNISDEKLEEFSA